MVGGWREHNDRKTIKYYTNRSGSNPSVRISGVPLFLSRLVRDNKSTAASKLTMCRCYIIYVPQVVDLFVALFGPFRAQLEMVCALFFFVFSRSA